MSIEQDLREKTYETDIVSAFIQNGYIEGKSADFDRDYALDTTALLTYVKTTQATEWKRYSTKYAKPEEQFIKRFCDVVAKSPKGILDILRKGFTDKGSKFFVLQNRPETDLNESLLRNYEANIFTCTRQLYYSKSNKNSVDIVLFINGIPLVSMELKCELTGQSTKNAIEQYRFTRSPKELLFEFKKRVLVHFAVDLQSVFMTTQLDGKNTYFLPFNQGSAGAGNVGGSGNPPNPNAYPCTYLWEDVLTKERFLELVFKYIHITQESKKNKKTGEIKLKEIVIFPRYHQLDVVTKLLADVKEKRTGQNYLIQHSAGSGKSNSIAWLAHRLSDLHDAQNNKIFKTILVVTDRRVLDSQLQATVGQFVQTEGVLQNIDKNSVQLRDAINNGVQIIVTTLHKFPVIYKEVKQEKHAFAIIVDEAHSSQTGEASKKLKKALGDTEEALKEFAQAEAEETAQNKDEIDIMNDILLDELASQGRLPNLSFFAFTATPKPKTLQMFGNEQEDGTYTAYHTYSMRQAIDEGFILDVLKHYMTYQTYYKIIKKIADNPELDSSAGMKAISQYENLHPYNISQKVAVILEHFKNITMGKIEGKAKAMVVTASRLHAVRYFVEIKKQINEKALQDKLFSDLGVLVAFSGEIEDSAFPDKNKVLSEEKLNMTATGERIKEKQLPDAFNSDEFHILVVAEKYQTGFDEPLLHTMFVDKKLSGVKAVQTISRLNRTTQDKHDTFVLDFVNSADDMKKAFEPYYEATVLEEGTDPNVLYDMKTTLDNFNIYQESEVKAFCDIFFSAADNEKVLAKAYSCLRPALERLQAMENAFDDAQCGIQNHNQDNKENANRFKTTVARFNRIYAFITQVYRLSDPEIHGFSVYLRFLQKLFPKGTYSVIDLNKKIELEYYRLEKKSEGSIFLESTKEGFRPITGEAGSKEKELSPLEELIDKINERFGTNFTQMDKVGVQLKNDFKANPQLVNYAKDNSEENFNLIYEKSFQEIAAKRYNQNDDFFKMLFSNQSMLTMLMNGMRSEIYRHLREDA